MTILYFGVVDWYYLRQRPQHMARELAARTRVVYAHPRTFLGSWRARHRLPAGALAAWRDDPEGEGRTLSLYEPLGGPRHRGDVLRSFSDRFFLGGLRRELRRRRLTPDLIWLGHPSHERYLEAFGNIPLIYDCMDDWGAFPDAGEVVAGESRLIRRARWVLASSQKLADRLRAGGATVHLVPNGVEHERFRGAIDLPVAAGDRTDPRASRIALTIGTFGPWIDFELIGEIARACPGWHFRLVGPIEADPPAGIPRADNLEWVGRRPYEELPLMMATAAAAFLPFRLNSLTASVDPVKVYEFLAAGLAVAAVPLPELAKFTSGVVMARTGAEFRVALETARELGATPSARRILSDSVAGHSWAGRAASVLSLLQSVMDPESSRAFKGR